MAILLKILCFSIWMVIMLVLIHGSQRKRAHLGHLVRIQLHEQDDVEIIIRQAMQKIDYHDSLVIEDTSSRHHHNRIKVAALKRKNPSIMYYTVREN